MFLTPENDMLERTLVIEKIRAIRQFNTKKKVI